MVSGNHFRLLLIFAAVTVAMAQMADPVIDGARKAAANYAQSLPDYIVKRTTTRHLDQRQVEATKLLDTVTGDVAVEHGKEVYTNIKVNGDAVTALPGGGAWSAGEFSTQMLAILTPESAAQFTHQHAESIRSHPSYRYDFAIDQAHSSWHLSAANLGNATTAMNYSPAYGGKIWIDRETGRALRIEMAAKGLPSGFPLASVESDTDYDFVKIGDGKYLLPVHSETTSCEQGGMMCLRNETDFQNYDKFSANSSITFDRGAK